LSFGQIRGDALTSSAVRIPHRRSGARYCITVVRSFSGPTQLCEQHLLEDLAGEWLRDLHINPLRDFFERSWLERAPLIELKRRQAP